MEKIFNPMSKEFQEEAKRLGLTGRQLVVKYQKDGKSLEKIKKIISCCNCGSYNTYIDSVGCEFWHKHDCQKEICTRYLCEKCYKKDYYKCGLGSVAAFRTGFQNTKSTRSIGKKSQKLACELYEWEDLDEKNDNHDSPLDCYDPKTGLYYQVQGRRYNPLERRWSFGHFEREFWKKYEAMVCFCFSEDRKIVERIYKFFKEEMVGRSCVSILKCDSNGNSYNRGWYEKSIVTNNDDLKKANDIWNGYEIG